MDAGGPHVVGIAFRRTLNSCALLALSLNECQRGVELARRTALVKAQATVNRNAGTLAVMRHWRAIFQRRASPTRLSDRLEQTYKLCFKAESTEC